MDLHLKLYLGARQPEAAQRCLLVGETRARGGEEHAGTLVSALHPFKGSALECHVVVDTLAVLLGVHEVPGTLQVVLQ